MNVYVDYINRQFFDFSLTEYVWTPYILLLEWVYKGSFMLDVRYRDGHGCSPLSVHCVHVFCKLTDTDKTEQYRQRLWGQWSVVQERCNRRRQQRILDYGGMVKRIILLHVAIYLMATQTSAVYNDASV